MMISQCEQKPPIARTKCQPSGLRSKTPARAEEWISWLFVARRRSLQHFFGGLRIDYLARERLVRVLLLLLRVPCPPRPQVKPNITLVFHLLVKVPRVNANLSPLPIIKDPLDSLPPSTLTLPALLDLMLKAIGTPFLPTPDKETPTKPVDTLP